MADSFDPQSNVKRSSRWRWRWARRVAVSLCLLLLVGAGKRLYSQREYQKELEEALAELDRTDLGWRLADIEAARAVIPDEENGALVATTAASMLPQSWPPNELDEKLRKLEPVELLDNDLVVKLRDELGQHEKALDLARKLVQLPRGRHPIHYERNVYETRLPSQGRVRATTQLLWYEAILRSHDNEMHGAMSACRAALNAGRSLGDEPTLVSQMIRNACVISACQATERVLAQGEPVVDDLAAMMELLRLEETHNSYSIGVRGERAGLHDFFGAMENGDVTLEQFNTSNDIHWSWGDRLLVSWYMLDLRKQHSLALSLMNRMVDVTELPSHEQEPEEKALEAEIRGLTHREPFTRLLTLGPLRAGDWCRREHASVRCLLSALALERYRKVHGDWPESLEKLVPELLSAVPLDPYDGEPLRYKRLDDGGIVYSVSSDREDNGGALDRQNPTRRGADVGCRLWDVKHRRQPPLPKPKPVEPDEGM